MPALCMRPCFWLVLAFELVHAAGRQQRNTNIDAGIVHETMFWRVLAFELVHALLYVCMAFVVWLLHVLLPTVAACCHAAAANSCWLPLCWCGCLVLRWCLCCLLLTLVTVKLRAVSVKLRVFAGNKLCQMYFEDHVRNEQMSHHDKHAGSRLQAWPTTRPTVAHAMAQTRQIGRAHV